jgi:mutator protein MutT
MPKSMDKKRHRATTLVGVAVVLHEGRCLVGVRSTGQVLAGHAEFPGGKCEPRELFPDCVARETREETGLDVVPVRCLRRVDHDYAHGAVSIEFWKCEVSSGVASQVPAPPFEWVPIETLASLPFPDANRDVVRELVASTAEIRR